MGVKEEIQLNKAGEVWCPRCGRVYEDESLKTELRPDAWRQVGGRPYGPCELCGAGTAAPGGSRSAPSERPKKRGSR